MDSTELDCLCLNLLESVGVYHKSGLSNVTKMFPLTFYLRSTLTLVHQQSSTGLIHIPRESNFRPRVISDCTISFFRLPTLSLNHVMFGLQSHQYIVQHKKKLKMDIHKVRK